MSILNRGTYTFNAISNKIPMAYFKELKQTILKFLWNQKRPQTDLGMMRKKTKAGRIMLPDCKLYYKAVITKTAWYGTNTHTQINTTEKRLQKWTIKSMIN